MAAYVEGDRRSFALLFERWAPRLHGFFLCALGEPAVADDLLQQTFLNIHRGRGSFLPLSRLQGWFFGIAANALQDELRRRKRTPLATEDDQEELARSADLEILDPMETQERALAVRAAIDRLPESQRAVLYLHRFEEMPFAEIARVLGTSEGAIKLRAFRAYGRLRRDLQPLMQEGNTR